MRAVHISYAFLLSSLALAACSTSAPAPQSWQPDPDDKRTLLTWEELAKINTRIVTSPDPEAVVKDVGFTAEPPTETATYANTAFGFTVQLPYNPAWSTDAYLVPPFDQSAQDKVVRFGPPMRGEGGGFGRTYTIQITPPRTPADAIADADAQHRAMQLQLPDTLASRAITVGSAPAVRYVLEGLCTAPVIEVSGPAYNYRFSTCTLDRNVSDAFTFLEGVAGTMTFLQ